MTLPALKLFLYATVLKKAAFSGKINFSPFLYSVECRSGSVSPNE